MHDTPCYFVTFGTGNIILPCNCITYHQGRSQEFSFTEARLKGKGASNAGGLGGTAPQKLTQYIKVTFSILLNSYDNTMAYYVCKFICML